MSEMKVHETHLELVRESEYSYDQSVAFTSPKAIESFCNTELNLNKQTKEHFLVFGLNNKNKLMAFTTLSVGTVNSSLVDPREVLKWALYNNAVNIIVVHNHPSGDTYPSNEDKIVTTRLKSACDIIGINLLDHIIIGDEYYSFKGDCLVL